MNDYHPDHRTMIEDGLEPLARGHCPYCNRTRFLRGPVGGAAVNIECAACGERYNVSSIGGQLISAQRIGYNGRWPDHGEWEIGHDARRSLGDG